MKYYKETPVFINGSGIFAKTAALNSSNKVNFSNFGNASLASSYPNDNVVANLSIDYYLKVKEDQFINELILFKNYAESGQLYPLPTPSVIQIGEIRGSFYLSSLSFSLEQNSLISVNANLISFVPVTGNTSIGTVESIKIKEGYLSNSYLTSFINSYNSQWDGNIYGFSYNFNKDIFPSFNLGKREPYEIIAISANEKTNIEIESFLPINFTGQYIDSLLDGYTKLNILPHNLTNINDGVNIELGSQVINSINHSFSPNQAMRVLIEANRKF